MALLDLSFESQYLSDETGEPLDLENMLRETEEDTHIRPIRIGKRKQLQAYLIAERLSQAETDKRRRSIRYRAKRPQKRFYDSQDGTSILPILRRIHSHPNR